MSRLDHGDSPTLPHSRGHLASNLGSTSFEAQPLSPAEPDLSSYAISGLPQSQPISPKAFIVEHLDPELAGWSSLEYQCIAVECAITSPHGSAYFVLSGVPSALVIPKELLAVKGMKLEHRTIEELYDDGTTQEEPKIGWKKDRVCLMDPKAEQELTPEDGDKFDAFLFGGILGDDPPQDRTSLLRAKGFATRRLGPKQMTTDTAARVTRMIVCNRIPMDKIPFIDDPELAFAQGEDEGNESVTMPFRYVKGANGQPCLPKGMRELIEHDADRPLDVMDMMDIQGQLEEARKQRQE